MGPPPAFLRRKKANPKWGYVEPEEGVGCLEEWKRGKIIAIFSGKSIKALQAFCRLIAMQVCGRPSRKSATSSKSAILNWDYLPRWRLEMPRRCPTRPVIALV
jgi:hypothetical protein